jgi:hypothetical protein
MLQGFLKKLSNEVVMIVTVKKLVKGRWNGKKWVDTKYDTVKLNVANSSELFTALGREYLNGYDLKYQKDMLFLRDIYGSFHNKNVVFKKGAIVYAFRRIGP